MIDTPPTLSDPLVTIIDLVNALENSAIPYFIVGSFASSIRGEIRATNDIDVVCQASAESLDKFLSIADIKFFVDTQMGRQALKLKRSFNIIHRETCLKVDLFLRVGELEERELRQLSFVPIPNSGRLVPVASAELIIVSKLRWFLKSNRVLDSQLRDIKGVLRANRERVDLEFVRLHAGKLGAEDLFEELLADSLSKRDQ